MFVFYFTSRSNFYFITCFTERREEIARKDWRIELLQRELQIAALENQQLKLNLLYQRRQYSLELYKLNYQYQHDPQAPADVYGEEKIDNWLLI